jgi:hypothetical protein
LGVTPLSHLWSEKIIANRRPGVKLAQARSDCHIAVLLPTYGDRPNGFGLWSGEKRTGYNTSEGLPS